MHRTYQRMVRAAGSSAHILRRSIWLSGLSAVAQGIAYVLLFPIFVALLDPSNDYNQIYLYLAFFVGLMILDAVLRYIEVDYSWQTQNDVGHEARLNLGNHLRKLPLEYLSGRQAGDLNVVISGNVNDVVMIMGGLFSIVLQTIITPVTAIILIFFIDWRLAMALALLFPLAVPFYRAIRTLIARENRVGAEAHADVASQLIEYAQGLAVLRSTRQVGRQSVRLQRSLANLRSVQAAAARLTTMPGILMSGVVQVGILLVTSLGIYWVLGGALDVAVLLALIAILVRFAEPLAIFANMASMFDFMEAALERIDALMDVEPLPMLADPPQVIERFDIGFDGVDFIYDAISDVVTPDAVAASEMADGVSVTGDTVLHDISFKLPERSLTALVGPSGSGKTTITKLISRYADPQGGSVTIGGVDVRNVTQSELMRHLSVVFQDVYLFDDTIRNNIRMARPAASDKEVEAAAVAANCHEFISRLPDGYDTTVGEIGGSLSGGERQRISIARAILKDAPIVLLDEPTSALDTESEVAVQRAIDKLVENKTVVVIAHRLSTVVAADTILVLDEGCIVESGSHTTLLEQAGRYAAMWSAQQEVRRWKVAA